MFTFDKLLLQQLRLLDWTQSQVVYSHVDLVKLVDNVRRKENLFDKINSHANVDTAYY